MGPGRPLALAVAALAAVPAAAAAAPQEVVTRATISGPSGLPDACAQARSESFPQLVVDPGDARRLSAVNLQDDTRAAAGAASSDGGGTFGSSALAGRPPIGSVAINARLTRTGDGALLAVYDTAALADLPKSFSGERAEFQAFAVRSTDEGRTWSAPAGAGHPVFLLLDDPEGRGPDDGRLAGSAKFDMASGPGGDVAVVWGDRAADGRGLLRMVRSTDGGRSFSPPFTALERDGALFQPAVAIADDGTIGVFFYDWTSDQPGDEPLSTDAWLATSRDGGKTWDTTHLDGPSDLRATHDPDLDYDGFPIGVYQDLVALPRGFGAAYSVGPPLTGDGRTDVRYAATRAAARQAPSRRLR